MTLWVIRALASPRFGKEELDRVIRIPILIIFSTIAAAMIGSHFHLSKPYFSFLAVLNFQTSWLSREIVFTILYFLSVGFLLDLHWFVKGQRKLKAIAGWLAILFGLITVYCMACIYLLPSQTVWNSPFTILSFYGSVILLGPISLAAILLMDLNFAEVRRLEGIPIRIQIVQKSLVWLAAFVVLVLIFLVFLNLYQVEFLREADASARVSVMLLLGIYQPLFILRITMVLLGVGWLVLAVMRLVQAKKTLREFTAPVFVSCLFVMIGEILGRFIFYATHIRIGI